MSKKANTLAKSSASPKFEAGKEYKIKTGELSEVVAKYEGMERGKYKFRAADNKTYRVGADRLEIVDPV